MCSIPLLPSMLGGVTPASVIREILREAGWTLCQNYGAASSCTWTLRTPVQKLMDTGEEPVFAFYLDNQVDESWHLVTEILVYMDLESTSYWQVNWDGLVRQLWRPRLVLSLYLVPVS